MQFVDLSAQQKRISKQIQDNIKDVLNHGQYIMGPEVRELEKRLSHYVQVKHAIACSSGTDALLLALMAYGVGPGDVVFTTPFTFIATAEVIRLLGALPVFVDIDSKTFNMDPHHLKKAINAVKNNDSSLYPLPKVLTAANLLHEFVAKGIIPVDLFGLPADYQSINAIAFENGLFVIEDAAQSFGAEYYGKKACSLTDMACTSFYPAKPLGCYGDGGMCFTDDDEKAHLLRSVLNHGQGTDKYDNIRIGINGRLDTLQAAVLLAKFDIFPEELEHRNRVAQRYSTSLNPHLSITYPFVPDGIKSVWAQYSLLAEDEAHRLRLQADLNQEDIPSVIYYPKPLHLQGAFSSLGYQVGDFPISERCSKRIFSLPMYPYLTEKDQDKIIAVINESAHG